MIRELFSPQSLFQFFFLNHSCTSAQESRNTTQRQCCCWTKKQETGFKFPLDRDTFLVIWGQSPSISLIHFPGCGRGTHIQHTARSSLEEGWDENALHKYESSQGRSNSTAGYLQSFKTGYHFRYTVALEIKERQRNAREHCRGTNAVARPVGPLRVGMAALEAAPDSRFPNRVPSVGGWQQLFLPCTEGGSNQSKVPTSWTTEPS